MKNFIKLILLASLFTGSFAGDTISFVEVKHILKKNPKLWTYLKDNFYFNEIGSSSKFGRQWRHLGGSRTSPYFFKVMDKKTKIGLSLSVNCQRGFFNESNEQLNYIDGEYTEDIFENAKDVKEYPISVTLYADENKTEEDKKPKNKKKPKKKQKKKKLNENDGMFFE